MAETNFQIKIGVETQLATLKAMEAELSKNIVRLDVLGETGNEALKKLAGELDLVRGKMAHLGETTDYIPASFARAAANSTRSTAQMGAGVGSLGAIVGQAGFQVQDFTTQVASGQSAMVALAQQGSQFAGVFGPTGAVVGAVLAVGLTVGGLIYKFLDLGDAMGQTEIKAQSLESTLAAMAEIRAQRHADSLSDAQLEVELTEKLARARQTEAAQLQQTQINAIAAAATPGGAKAALAAGTQAQLEAQLARMKIEDELAAVRQRNKEKEDAKNKAASEATLAEQVRAGETFNNIQQRAQSIIEKTVAQRRLELPLAEQIRLVEQEQSMLKAQFPAASDRSRESDEKRLRISEQLLAKEGQLLSLKKQAAQADQTAMEKANRAALQTEAADRQREQRALAQTLAAGQTELARLQANPLLLNNERDEAKLRLLIAQRDAVAQRLQLLNQEADTPESRAERDSLGQQQAGLSTQISGLTPMSEGGNKPTTAGDGAMAGLVGYINQIPDMAQRAQQAVMGIAQAMEQGIGNALTGLINRTMTWSQALLSIGQSIVNSIIQAFVRMAAQWIVQQLVMALFGNAIRAAQLAALMPMAAAAAALWAPAATAASIATFGGAAIEGAAMAKGAILASAVGFAEGGPVMGAGTGTSDSIPAWLSNGEYVMPASVVSQYGQGFFDDLRAGRAGLATPAPSSGGGSAGRGGSLSVVVTGSANEQRRYLESAEGERVVIDLASRQRLSLGIAG